MKIIIIALLLMQTLYGSSLNLRDIVSSIENNHPISQTIDKKRLYLRAKNLSQTAHDPAELYGSTAKANPKGLKSEYEYSVGISKKIPFGNTLRLDERIGDLENEADLLEESKSVLGFSNSIKNLYHQHCLDYKNYKSIQKNYNEFLKLYKKKQKAYEYQEISKIEIIQLKVEKNRLYTQLQNIKMTQKIAKERVFMLSRINYTSKSFLSCRDIYPIRANVSIRSDRFSLSKSAQQKRLQSTQERLKRDSKAIDYITLSLQYDKEIDVDKYGIGFSIPLNFTSRKAEQKRASDMYKYSALLVTFEQSMIEKRAIFNTLKSTLKSDALMIKSINRSIYEYQKTLLPLMKKSYTLGESSVIEYLLSRQNYHQLNQELFATQKRYYQRLFTLYTLSEIKDN
ncbi:MAG: TolC family protein [Sulfurovum sp.]